MYPCFTNLRKEKSWQDCGNCVQGSETLSSNLHTKHSEFCQGRQTSWSTATRLFVVPIQKSVLSIQLTTYRLVLLETCPCQAQRPMLQLRLLRQIWRTHTTKCFFFFTCVHFERSWPFPPTEMVFTYSTLGYQEEKSCAHPYFTCVVLILHQNTCMTDIIFHSSATRSYSFAHHRFFSLMLSSLISSSAASS